MGRPSKTAAGLARHATKEELEQRQAAEKALLTEQHLAEQEAVAGNEAAHREFLRVQPILAAIRKIIKSSPALADESIFKVLRSEIRCKPTDSEYTPLAYSRDKMDGKLANAFLADEAGAMDAYPIEAMRSSQITLESKLGIIISTQYPNDDNAMLDEIDISKKTLDGLLEGQARFSLLYEPYDFLKVLRNTTDGAAGVPRWQ